MSILSKKLSQSLLFLLMVASLLLLGSVTFRLTQCILPSYQSSCPFQEYTSSDFLLNCIPMTIALGFWFTGAVSFRAQHGSIASAFFFTVSVILSAGLLSSSSIAHMANIFYVALAFVAPLLLHFHLAFLNRPLRPFEQSSLVLFYVFGAGMALPLSVFVPVIRYPHVFLVLILIRILFMLAVFWTCLLLISGYQTITSLASRRQVRLVAFGSLFAFAPLVLLSVLPQTMHVEHVSFSATFPGLLSIPIVYAYGKFRSYLPLSEKRFRQVWVAYLLFVSLLSVYTLLSGALRLLFPQPSWVYTGGVAAIVVIIVFLPARSLLDRIVEWIFYGNETDYAQALLYLEEKLAGVLERTQLQALLLDELVSAVRPSNAILFLARKNDDLEWAGARGFTNDPLEQCTIPNPGAIAQFLLEQARPVLRPQLQTALKGKSMSPAEAHLLRMEPFALYLPLISEDQLLGLLVFGIREGDDRFTEEDQRLLGQLTRHAGAAIRNVIMAEDLRAGQEELALANQKQIFSQEQERRRLARELHDDTIQQILGLTFRLSAIRKRAIKRNSPEVDAKPLIDDLDLVRRDLLDVVSQLRGMIGELRPAGLDELGLRVALEGYIEQLRKTNLPPGSLPPDVCLQIDETLTFLSESLSICVFRVTQEALRNVFQHSQASQILVHLERLEENQLRLTIEDNGCGFPVPDRLSEFTQRNHYGLIGMWERIRAAGGALTIRSAVGQGTCLTAIFPFEEGSNGG
jgi:signal transduction histidine kinase